MDFKNKKAFTLAEMMVVIFVMSIILAMLLPVITATIPSLSGSSSSIWQYTDTTAKEDIYFGQGDTQGAVIGTSGFNGDDGRMLLNLAEANKIAILFKQKQTPTVNETTGNLRASGDTGGSSYGANSISLGTNTISGFLAGQTAIGHSTTNSAASTTTIGYGATASATNTTAIGDYYSAAFPAPTASVTGGIAIGTGAVSATGTNAAALGYGARATGNYAVYIGKGLSSSGGASGDYTLAMGNAATASTAYDIAIGSGSTSSNTDTLAIGHGSTSSGTYSTAIGSGASATANYANAIGAGATSSATNVTVVGANAECVDNSSIAFGVAKAYDTYSVAIGSGAIAGDSAADGSDSNQVAFGYNARALNPRSVAIGAGATASSSTAADNYMTAVGYNAITGGTRATAIGPETTAGYASNMAIGYGATANEGAGATAIGCKDERGTATKADSGCTAVGAGARATNDADGSYGNSVALGCGSYAAATHSIAIGGYYVGAANAAGYTTANGSGSIAIGNGALAYDSGTVAIGIEAVAGNSTATDASGAIAIGSTYSGFNTKSTGYGSIAVCSGATASGDYSIAIGYGATASATGSAAIGYGAQATHNYSTAIGYNSATTEINQIRLGNTTSGYVNFNGNAYLGSLSTGGVTTLYRNGSQYIATSSDRRLKDIKEKFTGGLNEIRRIKTYNFTFKKDKNKNPQVGVIAQDIKKIFPNAVTKGEKGYLMLRQDDIFYAMLNSIKELDIMVQNILKEVKTLVAQTKQIEDKFLSLINTDQTNLKKIKQLKNKNQLLKDKNKQLKEKSLLLEKRAKNIEIRLAKLESEK